MTILEAMEDPALFGRWFKGESWAAWRTFLAALFGLPMPTPADAELFFNHTGRSSFAPGTAAREGWVIAGRRGGKSRIAALVAVFLACFRDYQGHLAPGELATVAIIAADRRQARVVMRYIRGLFAAIPMLKAMVIAESRESIELSNRVILEVHTASFKATRGYTLAAVICDEVAFWPTDEDGANPDVEIINALRPGLTTIPGALLLCISSPYARKGALWAAFKHFGIDGDPVLVWQAPTAAMNPAVDSRVITDAYEADEASAAAEYGAQFRRDVETFLSPETIAAVTMPDRHELPPIDDVEYFGFTDPAGGSGADSMTLAIAHKEASRDDGPPRTVLDAIREARPPFNPKIVVKELADLLKSYRVASVTGDRYAGEWPRQEFRDNGIEYSLAAMTKSELYKAFLPVVTGGAIELLDHARLQGQLKSLERRTARGGRDNIDHPPRGHDDVCNAVAGVAAAVFDGDQHGMTEDDELEGGMA